LPFVNPSDANGCCICGHGSRCRVAAGVSNDRRDHGYGQQRVRCHGGCDPLRLHALRLSDRAALESGHGLGRNQRLRDGESKTEEHFVAYFRQLLRIKLRARYLSADIIDDVQQETFIRVFRALRTKDGIHHPERIGSYVNSVCNFVLQEFYRKQGKTQPSEDADTEIPDKVLNLEKLAIAQEVNERVREAVKSLAPRERDLIRRVFFQEMEKDEVCAELGVSRDYLRVLMHRAIEHLREVLENKDLRPKSREPVKKKK
jgi:RNA polymerase sigma-70 factor (ECF subfamily)